MEFMVTATKRYAVSETRTIEASSSAEAERIARQMIEEDEFFDFPDNLFLDGVDLAFVARGGD